MRMLIAAIVIALSCVQFASAQPRKERVRMTAVAGKIGDDGKQVVKLIFRMDKGVEITASIPEFYSGKPLLMIKVTTTDGKEVPTKFTYPKGIRLKNELIGDYFIYRDQVTIVAIVDRNEFKGPIRFGCRPQGIQSPGL